MNSLFAALSLSMAVASTPVFAAPTSTSVIVNASSDASIFTCSGCPAFYDYMPVLIAGFSIQGAVKFDTAAISTPVERATLSFTARDTFQSAWVDVYGYTSDTAAISSSEINVGTFLGRMDQFGMPSIGQKFTFDVTSFMRDVHAPYAAFNLRAFGMPGSMNFYSVRDTQGTPAQMLLDLAPGNPSDVPEPGAAFLALAGLAAVAAARKARRSS